MTAVSNRQQAEVLTNRADLMEAELDAYFNGLRQQVERIHRIIPMLVPNAAPDAGGPNVQPNGTQTVAADALDPQLPGQPAGEDSFEEDMIPLDLFKKIEHFFWNPDDHDPRHNTFDW